MKKTVLVIIAVLLTGESAVAERLSGSGFGTTREEAKKEALSDLAQTIKVEVKSEFKQVVTQNNKGVDEFKTKAIHLKSTLPVLGAEYNELSSKEGYITDAVLYFSRVKLYELELQKVTGLISDNLQKYSLATTNSGKTAYLKSILTYIDQYYKYRFVAEIMQGKNIPKIDITETEIKNRLTKLEQKADTIDFGAKMMARNFQMERIYIYPPTVENSSEITQFGSSVTDFLSKYLNTVSTPSKARHLLSGEYRILQNKKGIELTCRLLDESGNTIRTAMAFFLPSAYKGYEVNPVAPDFEKLLQSGYMVAGDFKAHIKTEKGRRDLLYKKGDTVRLFVKMNKPGYFYCIVHSLKRDKYSYLVHLNNAPSNRKFVYYISGDYVNKWVGLGDFSVVAPFGVETLNLFASTEDLIDAVPENFQDASTQLFKLGKKPSGTRGKGGTSPSEALRATRGLMMQKKREVAEASLILTSLEK